MDETQVILSKVDENEVIGLTSDLVKIRSISHEPPYERDVAKYLAAYWQQLGLEVHIQEVEKNRPNVIGILRGEGDGPTLMFEGHQDTNMVGSGWTRDPFGGEIDREQGWIYGCGSVNMKQSLAAYTTAVHAIIKSRVKLLGNIMLAATVKEIINHEGARFMIDSGIRPDVCILGEPTCSEIQIAHTGSFRFEIITRGTLLHISTVYSPTEVFPPDKRINAIYKSIEIVNRLRHFETEKILSFREHPIVGSPVLIIGYIEGGHAEKPGFSAEECRIAGDIRYVPGMTYEQIENDLEEFISQLMKDDHQLEAKIIARPESRYTTPIEVSSEEYIVKAIIKAHRQAYGTHPTVGAGFPHRYHQNESSLWVNMAGVPTPNYGAGGSEGVTKPDERISISELINITKAYALAAMDVCSKTKTDLEEQH
ncbi:MAG: M20/M25/M40 family metallo-hydrolase [Desulfobacterales bacterium]|nr:MAG: M20/M25/M40 family metallo-hydrolase [Desulfobacterales bacterium]